MKSLMYSLMLVVLMSSVAFAGHGYARNGVSFSISFNQPAYQPVYVYPQPVYLYPAPACTYAPVQSGYAVSFSTFWGNRGGRGYYGDHRSNYGLRRGRR